MKMLNIPRWPIADSVEEEKIKEVLRSSNWWRNAGTQVKLFEKEFSHYQGSKGGITVSNGTAALEIALKALGIGEGDEVIVPDFTFYSTVSAVLSVKAIPVIVDVREDTYCIDVDKVQEAITQKTKAIIPVHMAGNVSDMDVINEIASEYKLAVIEDASHAHGAVWKGKKAGSMGIMGTFSFQNAKLMTSGEGGIVLANDEELLNRLLLESNCGRSENDTNYQHVLIGTNARLSELQGAVLLAQLGRLDEQIFLREKNYQYLSKLLDSVDGIRLQKISDDMVVNPHYMIMFYYDKTAFHGAERAEFVEYLKSIGIPCNRSYESIHKLPVFKTLPSGSWRMVASEVVDGEAHCKNSERISDEVVCLNHNILLGDEQLIDEVVNIIKDFQRK